ncbi:hypothetical protein [Marilutibacter aestuarii]|uniref:Uncharacterized protein n=1 Tax=Marilutibacter aestuarii TaxID=1706195 RepID=A0A508AMZ5_9GAMM|nr:hypothetical protein [Lysobacter aestuarii]TQD51316.1 hypothetical protein FKV25_01615 [Lysobacter aestuarii]
MNATALGWLLLAATATATASPGSSPEGKYIAKALPDGSIELRVTGSTDAPTDASPASLKLGPMLEAAAAKECPTGYDLTRDPTPSVRVESGKLIASLGGIARCKPPARR